MASKGDRSLIVSVLLVCAVIAAGVTAYIKYAPADRVVNEVTNESQEGGGGVRVLTPYYAGDELKFKEGQVTVPKNVDPKLFAVNNYLRATKFVPKEAELITCKIDNGIAALDFNEAFRQSYGTDDERTVINGILTTMGQFSEVNYVKFLVAGQPLETLGNLDLLDPIEVIRLPESPAADGADKPAKS